MEKHSPKIMENFIDKLCDHLPSERIKLLIDSGFDQWETITYIQGPQLIDLGFDTQQCIIIIVAANSNAIEYEQSEIFDQEKIQKVMVKAKERDQIKKQQILKEEQQKLEKQQISNPSSEKSINSITSSHQIKEYPHKELTQNIISKGTFSKVKPGEKLNVAKVTVIALEEKQITQIANLQKFTNLVNLNLGNNYIYHIEGLNQVVKIKDLKLHHNNISKIESLQYLVNLQHLDLSSNYIARLENLTNNTRLRSILISKQKINCNFTFDQQTTKTLAYSLEKLQSNQNKIRNIQQLKHLTVVKEVFLAKNELSDVGDLAETITGMQNLSVLSFKENPLAKSPKYRDYVVILSKTLTELDGKKILPEERQYLVKLYALKHAKQEQHTKPKNTEKPTSMDLHGIKLKSQQKPFNTDINRATDLRGNVPFSNTKCIQFNK